MTDSYHEEFGGFKVPLYGLFHIRDIKNHPPFDKKSAEKLLNEYGSERVKVIVKGLEWAVKNREFDFQNVFPGMKYSNEDILWYFDKTLKEMAESELYTMVGENKD